MYKTRSFSSYDNEDMNNWLDARHLDGYAIERIIAVGSNSVLIVMRKI